MNTQHRPFIRSSVHLLVVGVFIGLLAGCDENSAPSGITGLPDRDKVGVTSYDTKDTSITIATSSYYTPVTASSSIFLSVGKANGYDSRAVIRWVDLPVGYADGGTIVSAKLILHALPYGIGDRNAALSFTVKEMTTPWSSYTITADSIAALHTDPTPRGSFSGVVSDTATIEVPLDSVLVRKWLHIIGQNDAFACLGVVLDPADGNTVVRAFSSMENTYPPQLQLILRNNDVTDTMTVNSYDDTFLARGPALPSTTFGIQGGLAYRSRLKMDVSRIPPGSIINHVSLYLCKDTAGSVTYFRGNDSVRIYESFDAVKDTMASPNDALLSSTDYTLKRFVVQGPALIRAVQRWVNNPAANYGLVLQKYGESSDIDLLVMRGAEASLEKRPRIAITYTLKH